jgi:hypothetical protein
VQVHASFEHGEDAVAAFSGKVSEERASVRTSGTSGPSSLGSQDTSAALGTGRMIGGSVFGAYGPANSGGAQKRTREAKHGSTPAGAVTINNEFPAPLTKRRQGNLDSVVVRGRPVSG